MKLTSFTVHLNYETKHAVRYDETTVDNSRPHTIYLPKEDFPAGKDYPRILQITVEVVS